MKFTMIKIKIGSYLLVQMKINLEDIIDNKIKILFINLKIINLKFTFLQEVY